MSKNSLICDALRAAANNNSPKKSAEDWAKEFQVHTMTVYRAAQMIGLSEYFASNKPIMKTEGELLVTQRVSVRNKQASVNIPVSAMRASGFIDARRVRFTATPGRIVIEPVQESKP